MTRLSLHFTLEELTATDHRGIDNTPSPEIVANLTDTAARMERVRSLLGDKVIIVTSGYRCPALNAAVGSGPTSAHLTGHAVDFNCYGYGDPRTVARALASEFAARAVAFDQMIHEFGRWVHVSFDPRGRRQLLTIDGQGTRAGLLPIR